jgi:hypothetical protein
MVFHCKQQVSHGWMDQCIARSLCPHVYFGRLVRPLLNRKWCAIQAIPCNTLVHPTTKSDLLQNLPHKAGRAVFQAHCHYKLVAMYLHQDCVISLAELMNHHRDLLVQPICWTSRHLEMLGCRFEITPLDDILKIIVSITA